MISALKRSVRYLAVGLTLLVVVVAPLAPDKALATHGPLCNSPDHEIIYGRNANCGYFLNNSWNGYQPYGGSGAGLLRGIPSPWTSEGLWEVDNVDEFVLVIRWHLQNNCTPGGGPLDAQRRNAAAFIILTMQGAPAGTPANAPCSGPYHVNNWEALVRQYAAAGLVDFNSGNTRLNGWYTRNTRIQGGAPDAAWYPDPNCVPPGNPLGFCAVPSIVFRAGPFSGPLYMIKKDCANPIDIPSPLTPLVPPSHPFSVTPTANAVPLPNTEAPTSARFETGASYSGSPSITTYDRKYFYRKAGSATEVTIQDPLPVTRTNTGTSATFTPVTLSLVGLGLTAGDQVCARNVVTPGAGTADPSGNVLTITDASNTSGDRCFTIVNLPYYQTYGGDTRAGSGFLTDGGTCATDTTATFLSLNKGSPSYTGGGSQLAAMAFGWIVDFSSGQLRTDATQPKPLSFANANPSNLSLGATTYGGGLMAGNATCAPNYYVDGMAATPAPTPLGASTSADIAEGRYTRGTQATPLNLTINGASLNHNTGSRTIYVYGNVIITGDITYAPGNYNGIDRIPSFRLVVRGNIYVEPEVSRLDGIYIAQPHDLNNDGDHNDAGERQGKFYTCAPGGSPPDVNELNTTGSPPNAGCRFTKLTVYGAVIADLIKLTRSTGTLSQSTTTGLLPSDDAAGTTAGENFMMTPEAWLTSDFAGGGEFDSVTTLPPVL